MEHDEIKTKFFSHVWSTIKYLAEKKSDAVENRDAKYGQLTQKEIDVLADMVKTDEQRIAMQALLMEYGSTLMHSVFATIDGADDIGVPGTKAVELVNARTGVPLTDAGLHEDFFSDPGSDEWLDRNKES